MPYSAGLRCFWFLPLLSWVLVQACSSNADHPPSGGVGVVGGESAGGSSAHAGRGSAAGGAHAAAGTAGSGTSEGGEAGAVAFGGDSGAASSDADSGAAGVAGVAGITGVAGANAGQGGQPSAGASGGGPAPICGTTQAWLEGSALAISTAADDQLGSITPDELTVAWTTSPNGVVTIQYADRAGNDAAFELPQSFVGAFALDRAALSPDGLRLVLVNADRRGFTEYTRAARGEAFGFPGVGPFAALEDYAQHTMAAGNSFADPLVDPDDKLFIYSEYGSGLVDTIQRTRRLFSGDPWSVGSPLVAAELQASGAQRRRPTGMSADGRTLFVWDEVLGQERAGFFDYATGSLASFLDLGQFAFAQPNADCTRLYYSGPGASSLDLFVATAQ